MSNPEVLGQHGTVLPLLIQISPRISQRTAKQLLIILQQTGYSRTLTQSQPIRPQLKLIEIAKSTITLAELDPIAGSARIPLEPS